MKTIVKGLFFFLATLPLFALAQAPTSYDSDGDGIMDSVDDCMYVKGLAKYNGCPYEKTPGVTDNDGDGVVNAQDACPDLFGTPQNNGCPLFGQAPDNASGGNLEADAVNSANVALFTTTSSSAQTDLQDFKTKLTVLLNDAKNDFAGVKDGPYQGRSDTLRQPVWVPGAVNAYVDDGSRKFYYANFGNYTDGAMAEEKANYLKKMLLLSLGETEWHYSLLGKSGFVQEYQVWQKNNNSRYVRIRTFVQKDNGHYNVYMTVEYI